MSVIKEFKEFAVKGNVVDMAVGIIIGGAFGKIVSSFVSDIVMPPIGMILGGVNFSQLYCNLGPEKYETLAQAVKAGAPVIKYGQFIQASFDFIIVAFAIFLMVKTINRLKKKEEVAQAVPTPTPEDITLLREIRDSLKK